MLENKEGRPHGRPIEKADWTEDSTVAHSRIINQERCKFCRAPAFFSFMLMVKWPSTDRLSASLWQWGGWPVCEACYAAVKAGEWAALQGILFARIGAGLRISESRDKLLSGLAIASFIRGAALRAPIQDDREDKAC